MLTAQSTVSQRGVVFFRKQDGLTDEHQKELMQRLGQLSGKPSTSGLHVHPIYPVSAEARAHKGDDDEISVISSKFKEKSGKVYGESKQPAAGGDKRANKVYADKDASKAAFSQKKQSMKTEWHSDIAFEHVPSDYTMLRLTEVPTAGGDTLWASGYDLYERLSPPYQKFLETLTATYHYAGLEVFSAVAERHGFKIHEGPRGSPDNLIHLTKMFSFVQVGIEFEAVHPVVRTNPVTGWRSLYAIGHHLKHINGVTRDEGKNLEDWFIKLLVENHDLQVRHRWESVNDLAIWDNRSTYHAATPDHGGFGHRSGHRAVSVGERPYLDPESRSKKETLGLA
ncbi:hypothetical protein Daus18300_004221 [Diaporthe australafricana]|uniref:TauD/TfdA-like domain-containing protein n=1 Tax=Diaporthe australafricana TaxID=127596 RepID=A0ABR3XA14_9PEZI